MVHTHYSLKAHNTFGLDVSADYFAAPATVDGLRQLLADDRYRALPRLVLGVGSNLLFCGNYRGLVIHPQINGMEKTAEDADYIYLRAGAGVVWDDLVAHTVANRWGGLENLSLIPGQVGAAPVQNIGAYGAEAKDTIAQVTCLLTDTGEVRHFSPAECCFGYRDSAFKHAWRDRAIVTHVTFRLHKQPQLCTRYGNVDDELKHYPEVTIATVRQAIMAIRRRKLPDPAELGSAGSFFKNPVVPAATADALAAHDPQLTLYPAGDGLVKLPAARLIERAGWKGRRTGHVGVHTQQALVMVHYGGGTGAEIDALAQAIQADVQAKFGVTLETEVLKVAGY